MISSICEFGEICVALGVAPVWSVCYNLGFVYLHRFFWFHVYETLCFTCGLDNFCRLHITWLPGLYYCALCVITLVCITSFGCMYIEY